MSPFSLEVDSVEYFITAAEATLRHHLAKAVA